MFDKLKKYIIQGNRNRPSSIRNFKVDGLLITTEMFIPGHSKSYITGRPNLKDTHQQHAGNVQN